MNKDKEKEQVEKIKMLRRELEEKLEEQLPALMTEDKPQVETAIFTEEDAADPAKAKKIIEALLFASSKPLTAGEIRRVLKSLTPKTIENLILELKAEYDLQERSFEILEIAGGFEIATRKDYAPWIFKIEAQKKAKQATQSALETLAILAYKQPITRAEIEDLRGVDVSGVLSTLVERNLIKIVGKKEVPGRPFLYGTTDKFLEHFGLKSLEGLPSIEEIKNLVENSVKKEDLLGTQKMVEMNPEPAAENSQPAEETQPEESIAESEENVEPMIEEESQESEVAEESDES